MFKTGLEFLESILGRREPPGEVREGWNPSEKDAEGGGQKREEYGDVEGLVRES